MPFATHVPEMPATMSAAQKVRCKHCQTSIPASFASAEFCCAGCEAVYGLLAEEGLGRYYALGGGIGTPVAAASVPASHAWLEPLVTAAEALSETATLELDVQGIHCAACVWLMNEVFHRKDGGVSITVNPALGKVRLVYRRGELDVGAFVRQVERFGYAFGPSRKTAAKASNDLPMRLGLCVALAMNVMLFQVSFYAGLSAKDGALFTLFGRLSLALSAGVVAIGGWPFFRTAWQGLRSRVLHLDLPIALGIALVFATSLVQARGGRGDLAYLDTLNTFIVLMLVGRWLQARVLERNRRFLLEDDGAEGFTVRRRAGDRLELIPAAKLAAGDCLLIAPGELIPVDAIVEDATARITTDWITGESEPRRLLAGATAPAGAFNSSDRALTVTARTAFNDSPLVSLLRKPPPRDASGAGGFFGLLARTWTAAVLVLACAGFLLWLPRGHEAALQIAVALLVVTCPCAIGIAIPLSYELAQARLRRAGFFVRSADLLDRLTRVRGVFFDKTGTLTLGRLALENADALSALSDRDRDAAYNLAVRSGHPVSACIAKALQKHGARFIASFDAIEEPGRGVFARVGADEVRLGRSDWAVTGAAKERATLFSRNGDRCFSFRVADAVRPDAAGALAALEQSGHPVWLISGDSQARTAGLGRALGIAQPRTFAQRSPEEKAALVELHGEGRALYLGDGVNDALAFQAALCAGTPAIDRPVMPGRSDFFLLGEGLLSLREALGAAQLLRQTVRRIIALSLAYNVVAVGACLLGFMTPLRAALVMPLSSLSILLFAVAALRAPLVTAPTAAHPLQQAVA